MNGNDALTKVLLHFDGSDASTTFTDSNAGGSAHTWTAAGNAQLDTAIVKFGTAAGLFDGTGDWITTPDSADFTLGAGDFTIDCWFNRAGGDGGARFISGQANSTGTTATTSFSMALNASNVIQFNLSDGATIASVVGTTAFVATGWHHVAAVRTGNILRLFIDGVQEGGDVAFSATVNDSANNLAVGVNGERTVLSWNGSIDEFRISVGIARWVTAFGVPTAAYGPDAPYIPIPLTAPIMAQ